MYGSGRLVVTGVLLHQFFLVQALEKVTVCDGGVREKPESEKEAGLQELLLIFFKGKGLVFHLVVPFMTFSHYGGVAMAGQGFPGVVPARETCHLHEWHGGAQYRNWKASLASLLYFKDIVCLCHIFSLNFQHIDIFTIL